MLYTPCPSQPAIVQSIGGAIDTAILAIIPGDRPRHHVTLAGQASGFDIAFLRVLVITIAAIAPAILLVDADTMPALAAMRPSSKGLPISATDTQIGESRFADLIVKKLDRPRWKEHRMDSESERVGSGFTKP